MNIPRVAHTAERCYWDFLPQIKRNPSRRKQLLKDRSHLSIFMCRLCTAGTTSPAEGQGHLYFWLRRTCAKRMQHVLGILTVRGATVFRMFGKGSFSKSFYLWKNYQVLIFAWGCSSSWDQRSKPTSSIWQVNWSWLSKLEMWYWWQTGLKGSNINP